METIFLFALALFLGILVGILLVQLYNPRKNYNEYLRNKEVKQARTMLMKVRDRQCLNVSSKCSKCEYYRNEQCLANQSLKNIIDIETLITPEDIDDLDSGLEDNNNGEIDD
jgi:hypothetical protein